MSVMSVENGFVAPMPATHIATFSRGRENALRWFLPDPSAARRLRMDAWRVSG